MKIKCICGYLISDNTDCLSTKGHLIPDKLWNEFWENVDDAIEKSGPTVKEKEAACMKLRYLKVSRLMWQYPECGKLYIADENGNLNSYMPVEKASKKILDSAAQTDAP